MWENLVARSRPFWRNYFPALRAQFPGQLDGVTAEDVYRAVNRVEPSFIRVEADECTYNLHIVIRFEIELALVEGNLAVQDVPEAWNAKVKQYLGIDTPNDAHGCLQDIHWAHGGMGYFPTYALGNLYAAQLFHKAEQDIPTLWTSIETGDFAPLRNWLRTHVHQIGRRKTATQIVQEATGAPPSADAFIEYLNRKYGELYRI
jgi:carboxypeptidase Taq